MVPGKGIVISLPCALTSGDKKKKWGIGEKSLLNSSRKTEIYVKANL